MTYHPSRLELPATLRTVYLRFVPPNFELALLEDGKHLSQRVYLTGAQIRQVTLDMRPVEVESIRLSYAARHILIEIDGKLFIRVLDVDFMKLHGAAATGAGETVHSGDSFDLR